MTLASHSALGLDPTIHICNSLCQGIPHNNVPGGVDVMPNGAIGWIIDDDKNKKEYALKDCWVDADIIDHEVSFLKAVDGGPNVVQLVKYWDVEYNGHVNSTSNICEHVHGHLPNSPIFVNKIHHRMLLTPCGLPLTTFKSVPELVNVFLDLVVTHRMLMIERKVLHGDLSPNNLIIYEGKGYFINFDHAKFVQLNSKAKDSHGTGTIPYISCRLLKLMGGIPTPELVDHRASNDFESFFYIFLEFMTIFGGPGGLITDRGVPPKNTCRWNKVYMMMDVDGLGISGSLKKEFVMEKTPVYEPAPYFQVCYPILEDWRMAIRDALINNKDVFHDQIQEIIQWGLDNIDNFPSPEILLPLLMPSATPMHSSVSSPAATWGLQLRHSSQISHPAHSLVPSGSSSFAPPPPPSQPASSSRSQCRRWV
ncbi:hypothetical protein C8R48DRAFT_673411 [Suillus tomentosus]|nr:hypothetical protein C8R48DRAFT_673411 [Suillus tomentosus]